MTRDRPATILYCGAAAFLASAIAFAFVPAASAATGGGGGGGTNWGSNGSSGPTSSAVTVRWDNDAPGQPSYDQVPRNASQILPYTGGATYDDTNSVEKQAIQQDFANLSVTVDQTAELGNQAVSLSYTGVANDSNFGRFLNVFQCWGGGSSVDGLRADEPDPTHCETTNRTLLLQDGSLIGKGDLPSPLEVDVTGYEDPGGTSAHLTAQVGKNLTLGIKAQEAPAAGTVQFATGKHKLGSPVPVVNGVATADVSGLAKGASTQVIATYTPAHGQNYQPAVPSAPLTLPWAYSQGSVESSWSLVSNNPEAASWDSDTSGFFPGSLVDVAALAGTFRQGDKIRVTLNAWTGTTTHDEFGLPVSVPNPPGSVLHDLGTVTAASDGSTMAAFKLPSTPAQGEALVFTDEAHPGDRVVDLVTSHDFQSLPTASSTDSNQAPDNQTTSMPFNDIEGYPQANGESDFNTDTSNELDDWQAPATASGTTTREFTVSTSVQDSNLGCGAETGSPSTSICWLVIVPVDDAGLSPAGVLSPSEWAQRLQVELSFSPIPQFCSASMQGGFAVGSELLGSAMSSWGPAICARDKINITFEPISDSVARQEYEQDTENLIFTTQPVDDKIGGTRSLYAPAGLAGVTIGLNLPTANGQVTGLKLDARLVAKLLTQSYLSGIDPPAKANPGDLTGTIAPDPVPYAPWGGQQGIHAFAPWSLTTEFADLFADPEFKALNPGFNYTRQQAALAIPDTLGSLVVSSTASDPIGVLWHWILSDPEAKAFLDGCPDTASEIGGHPTVINPFFSTGTYAQCRSQAAALRKTANQEIAETTGRFREYARAAKADLSHILPVPQAWDYTYDYSPVTYSYSTPQFPLPDWYWRPANGYSLDWVTANSTANMHAEESNLANVEADISVGAPPWLLYWCDTGASNTCTSGYGTVGQWTKIPASYFIPLMGVTDTPAAAQFQTVTAQLCDDHAHCVGADSQSLLKAESQFTPTSAPGVLQTSMTPDEAHGAYPLTVPVYAAVNEKGLPTTDAADYAAMLEYIRTAGNQPGLLTGQLPPGYAPLPSRMLAQDAAAVAELDKLAKAEPPSKHKGPSTPPTTRSPGPSPTASPPVPSGSVTGTRSATERQAGSTPSASPAATSSPRYYAVTAGTQVDFPRYGVIGGLVGAVVCGGIAPFVERRRRPLRGKRLRLPGRRRVPSTGKERPGR
jgi:hypothetical protein